MRKDAQCAARSRRLFQYVIRNERVVFTRYQQPSSSWLAQGRGRRPNLKARRCRRSADRGKIVGGAYTRGITAIEIFNVHIFEFLLIGGLALVVFGPERLPEVGRFLGQQVARFLAWQQQSPELQMLNEVRGEFEREIASLRDELVRTRKQLDISSDISAIKDELRPMLDLRGSLSSADTNSIMPPTAPLTESPSAPEAISTPDAAEALFDVAESAADETPLITRPAAQTVPAAARPDRLALTEPTSVLGPAPASAEVDAGDERASYLAERRQSLHDAPVLDDPALSVSPDPDIPPAESEHELLLRRLGELSAELQALVGELQERGVIGAGWRESAQASEQETLAR